MTIFSQAHIIFMTGRPEDGKKTPQPTRQEDSADITEGLSFLNEASLSAHCFIIFNVAKVCPWCTVKK